MFDDSVDDAARSYNFYESLSGIETKSTHYFAVSFEVTISTNPYQGLKLRFTIVQI